jgi:hypothetical protein
MRELRMNSDAASEPFGTDKSGRASGNRFGSAATRRRFQSGDTSPHSKMPSDQPELNAESAENAEVPTGNFLWAGCPHPASDLTTDFTEQSGSDPVVRRAHHLRSLRARRATIPSEVGRVILNAPFHTDRNCERGGLGIIRPTTETAAMFLPRTNVRSGLRRHVAAFKAVSRDRTPKPESNARSAEVKEGNSLRAGCPHPASDLTTDFTEQPGSDPVVRRAHHLRSLRARRATIPSEVGRVILNAPFHTDRNCERSGLGIICPTYGGEAALHS